MLKTILLLAITAAVPQIVRAQPAEEKTGILLFDEFKPGTVILRGGKLASATVNFNTATGTFYVQTDDETAMELSDTETVAAITVEGRYFENAGKTFYERMELGDGAVLYVQWRTDVFEKGKKGAYGTTSSLSNIKSVSDASLGGRRINLKEAVEYASRPQNSFYVKSGRSYRELKSMKAVKKLVKGHEKELDRYAEENKPDFGSLEDVKNLVIFIHPFLQ